MVRRWLQRYWRTVIGLLISAMLVAVMVRLVHLVSRPACAYDPRLDGIALLVSVGSVWAMMALRNWAKRHER